MEQVAQPRISAMRAKAADEAMYACRRELQGLVHAVLAHDAPTLQERVARAVDALVGAPLATFEPITTFIGFHAFELLGKNRRDDAAALVGAGLTLLPEDPTLLGILGEIELQSDRPRGIDTLRRALAREEAMAPQLRQRVRSLVSS